MIVVCGEALIDMIGQGGTYHPHPGGGPTNTAVALGRLGRDVRLLTALGRDAMSDLLRAHVTASGVDRSWIREIDVPTTLALVSVDEHGSASYEFYVTGTTVTEIPVPAVAAFADVAALHVGTLALAVEPTAGRIAPLVTALAAARPDLVVMLDPNCRPAFISAREQYTERILGLCAASTMVKVSNDDLAWMFPSDSSSSGAQRLLDAGAGMVLLTLGGDGAQAITTRATVSVQPPPIHVADTVGAGDTFGAGILAWLDEHALLTRDAVLGLSDDQLGSMLTFAATAASVTCSRPGADPPWRHELPAG